MLLSNLSSRTVRVAPSVTIAAGAVISVAADATWLIERPLVKAYIADGTLALEDPTAKADSTDAPAVLAEKKVEPLKVETKAKPDLKHDPAKT